MWERAVWGGGAGRGGGAVIEKAGWRSCGAAGRVRAILIGEGGTPGLLPPGCAGALLAAPKERRALAECTSFSCQRGSGWSEL